MTTRIFPIFRSVQRAVGVGVGLSKHQPALAATARIQSKEDESSDGETEKGSADPHLSEGHHLYVWGEDNNGIAIERKATWPINSEAARQLRREFAQDGFRRLYNVASGQVRTISVRDDDGIQNSNENEGDNDQHDGEDIAGEITQVTETDPNNAIDENETPPVLNCDEDWVYYAQ